MLNLFKDVLFYTGVILIYFVSVILGILVGIFTFSVRYFKTVNKMEEDGEWYWSRIFSDFGRTFCN